MNMSEKGKAYKSIFEYNLENEEGIPVTIYKKWNTVEMSSIESRAIKQSNTFELYLQSDIDVGDVIQPSGSRSFWKVVDTDEHIQEQTMIKLIAKVVKIDNLGNEIEVNSQGKAVFNAPVYGGVQVGGFNNSQNNTNQSSLNQKEILPNVENPSVSDIQKVLPEFIKIDEELGVLIREADSLLVKWSEEKYGIESPIDELKISFKKIFVTYKHEEYLENATNITFQYILGLKEIISKIKFKEKQLNKLINNFIEASAKSEDLTDLKKIEEEISEFEGIADTISLVNHRLERAFKVMHKVSEEIKQNLKSEREIDSHNELNNMIELFTQEVRNFLNIIQSIVITLSQLADDTSHKIKTLE